MRVIATKHFLKEVDRSPIEVQKKLDALLAELSKNPFYPLLHTKRLKGGLRRGYSFRISRDWRAIFVFEDQNTIKLINIGDRKDIYR